MSFNPYFINQLKLTYDLIGTLIQDEIIHSVMSVVSERCITCLKDGGKIMLAGNGGSAADAQHIAGELVSKFAYDRPGLPAIALTTDTSILTAVGNDYGFEQLFSRQIQALGVAGDVFIAYTTSGSSKNILAALLEAKSRNIYCVGVTGNRGGEIHDLCDQVFAVPSAVTPKIQEAHLIIGHALCGIIEKSMFANCSSS